MAIIITATPREYIVSFFSNPKFFKLPSLLKIIDGFIDIISSNNKM